MDYTLDNLSIQKATEDVAAFLENKKIDHHTALRIRLTLEELLLRIQEAENAPESVELLMKRRFSGISIILRYDGKKLDPTVSGHNENDDLKTQILEKLGLAPIWRYRNGVNSVKLALNGVGGVNKLVILMFAVLSAILLGAAGDIIPEAARVGITNYLLTPISQAFTNLLNTFSGLMIFFVVSTGVFGMGDISSFSRIGKVVFTRCLVTVFVIAALAVSITAPFFYTGQSAASDSGSSSFGSVVEMIFSVFPKNPVQPFLDGNSMQIIFLAIFVGVVILIMGKQAKPVAELFNGLDGIARTMIGIVTRFVPVFIFVSLLRQIWSGMTGQLLRMWKPFVLFLLANVIVIVIKLAITAFESKASPLLLLKKIMPACVVGFTTCSSIAAFPTSEKNCVNKLGVSKKLFDFAYPVSSVIFMPSTVIYFAVLVLAMADVYNIPITPVWLVTAVLLTAVLGIAVPPIPGAGLTCYGILFAQLGIPLDGIAVAATLAAGIDFFATASNLMMLQLEVTGQAKALSMLDKEKLMK